MLTVDPHPLLQPRAFTAGFPKPLGELPSPALLVALLRLDAPAPFKPDDATRGAVRDLLRHGGFKPTGRSKPASEYLARAAGEAALSSINLAVDACNAASLHSGLPISVIDLELAKAPFRIGIAGLGEGYPFNAAGQVIDLEGLVCLFDAQGPCANAVKDAQRTKTCAATTRTLAIVWGTRALDGLAARTAAWYRELLAPSGATVEDVL
jgi:DNA/RNA-binding domain of Phe-tRNA-synthetase-like protein